MYFFASRMYIGTTEEVPQAMAAKLGREACTWEWPVPSTRGLAAPFARGSSFLFLAPFSLPKAVTDL